MKVRKIDAGRAKKSIDRDLARQIGEGKRQRARENRQAGRQDEFDVCVSRIRYRAQFRGWVILMESIIVIIREIDER